MDIEVWHTIFKASLIAILSFFIPFSIGSLIVASANSEVGDTTTKKEWMIISLSSFLIMIVVLLIFGMNITNK